MYMKPFSEYWKTDGSAVEWTCTCKIPRLRAMPLPGGKQGLAAPRLPSGSSCYAVKISGYAFESEPYHQETEDY